MRSKEEQEHLELSWKIIEWKVAYYLPEFVHKTRKSDYTISDAEYDAHERRYLELCRLLGKRNTVVHKGYPEFEDVDSQFAMMEVEEERYSVQLVIAKLSSRKGSRI